MSVKTLIDADGKLDTSSLKSIFSDEDDGLSIVVSLGAYGLRQSELLNDVFETTFNTSSTSDLVSACLVEGHDSAVMSEPPRHLLIFNIEAFDGPSAEREELREMSWNLSISLADVVFFVVRMHDLARTQSNGLEAFRASLTQMLMLRADDVVPTPSSKRALIVVVRDYESDVLSRDEIVSGFLQEMQTMYSKVAKPPRSPSRISDLFEFEFVLVPNEALEEDKYQNAIDMLKEKLLEPTDDDYMFEGSAYSHEMSKSPADAAGDAWNRMEKEKNQNMPPQEDLMSAFDCDNAMRKVFEKYQRSVRAWREQTDNGGIIDKFGEEASDIVKQTIEQYQQDASAHKKTREFRRKREELKDLLDADLYNLFVVQVAKLREVTYREFKDKLDDIDDSESKLDRRVKGALRDAQKSFRTKAEALRPNFSTWRFDNDAQELASKMREDATDKLQRARIADYQEGGRRGRRRAAALASATPRRRQPISVGIHYLNPAPFGFKDSRYEKLTNDDSVEYKNDSALFGQNSSNPGGLSVPLAPSRDSGWHRANQNYVYSERK